MFKKLSFFIFLISIFNPFHHNAMAWDTCPMDGTKIDVSELININRPAGINSYVCNAPVDSFNMTVKQLAMCTADPTDYLNGNSSVDPCFYFWNHREGDAAISMGVTPAAETSFPAIFPPTGTYTHGYALTSMTFEITAEYETNAIVTAGNEAGNAWTGALFVGPGNRSGSMEDMANGSWQLFTEGFLSSQSSKNTLSFSYNSLDTQSFLNTLSLTSVRGSAQNMYVVNSSGTLASNYSEAQDLLVVETYLEPRVITDLTKEIIYKYSNSLAGRFFWENLGGGNWLALGFQLGYLGFDMEFN